MDEAGRASPSPWPLRWAITLAISGIIILFLQFRSERPSICLSGRAINTASADCRTESWFTVTTSPGISRCSCRTATDSKANRMRWWYRAKFPADAVQPGGRHKGRDSPPHDTSDGAAAVPVPGRKDLAASGTGGSELQAITMRRKISCRRLMDRVRSIAPGALLCKLAESSPEAH